MNVRGKEAQPPYSFSSTTVAPPPPWSRAPGRSARRADAFQELGDRAAQLAGAVAVDDPQVFLADQRLVEELLGRGQASSTLLPIRFSSVRRPGRGCRSTLTRRDGCAAAARRRMTRRSSILARSRLPRTSTSASRRAPTARSPRGRARRRARDRRRRRRGRLGGAAGAAAAPPGRPPPIDRSRSPIASIAARASARAPPVWPVGMSRAAARSASAASVSVGP